MKIKGIFSLLLCAALLLAMATGAAIPVQAATVTTDYIYFDEDGNSGTGSVEATVLEAGSELSLTDGWYVVTGDQSVTKITITGDVKLILGNSSKLTVNGSNGNAAIYINDDSSLTIYAQSTDESLMGQLEATGGSEVTKSGAGIGGSSTATLNIHGGSIRAKGASSGNGYGSAGIGGSFDAPNGGSGIVVNIYSGIVTATGGGDVYDYGGAGIGGSSHGGDGGSVNIFGGTVEANGSYYGAGIGSGDSGDGGSINIYGGTVTASGGNGGAGIGGGYRGNGGSINISGGTVEANGSYGGAGIGGGMSGIGYGGDGGNGGSIIISGGTVTANGGHSGGAGIGGGIGGDGSTDGSPGAAGTVVIAGGSVNAGTGGMQDTPDNGLSPAEDVYLTTVTLEGITTATQIEALSITGASYYGTNGMFTDDDGKLYLYLPDGAVTTAARTAEHRYGGSVSTDNSSGAAGTLAEDDTAPDIDTVTPFGADAPIDGNIVIRFKERMNPSLGTVSLNGGAITLPAGSWSAGDTVYTVPYTGLSYSTSYTVTISGFTDLAGNTMADHSTDFTTCAEPLVPSLSTGALTIAKGAAASFTVAFGQGAAAATGADITVSDANIASVSETQLTAPGTIAVSGLKVGSTNITVVFNDPALTTATVYVTVEPVAPVWPAGSSLTASGTSRTGTTLTWTAAQDNTSTITAYKIYQDGREIATVDGNVLTYKVSGLSRSTSYSFRVQAGNADGAWTNDGPETTVKTRSGSSGSKDSTKEETQEPQAPLTPPIPPAQPQIVIQLIIGQRNTTVNGSPSSLDAAPFIDLATGRTLIPIRFVSEVLGAAVTWDPATRQIRIALGETEIILILDSRTAFVNGQAVQLDQPPVIIPPGRTFVPLRFIGEALGATVEYDGTTGQISIFR